MVSVGRAVEKTDLFQELVTQALRLIHHQRDDARQPVQRADARDGQRRRSAESRSGGHVAIDNQMKPRSRFEKVDELRDQLQALFEQQVFERLIAISGIGPKLALAVLSGIEPPDLVRAIKAQDVARLTAIPGSSDVFLGGIIAYDDEVKIRLLGVERAMIRVHGAVSEEAAAALAVGAVDKFHADLGVAATAFLPSSASGYAIPACVQHLDP